MRKYPLVLIIDDSASFREFSSASIKESLKLVHVRTAKNGVEGLKMYLKHKPDLVLLDLKMPGLDGFKVLDAIVKSDSKAKVIMNTAYAEDQLTVNSLIKLGACNFVAKPMNRELLLKAITDILYNKKIMKPCNV